jgi:hypothetical protein
VNGARAFAAASEAAAVAELPERRPVEPEDTEDCYFKNMSKFSKMCKIYEKARKHF